MKNNKPKTLDSARVRIADLEKQLEAQTNANINKLVSTTSVDGKSNSSITLDGKIRSEHAAANTPEDLKLPHVTEETLLAAIDAETDYKAKWLLQRSLARVQTARAVVEVKARSRR